MGFYFVSFFFEHPVCIKINVYVLCFTLFITPLFIDSNILQISKMVKW